MASGTDGAGAEGGSRARAWAVDAAVAALAALHAASFRAAGPVDDDFIVYRYARNLLEGHGFVFNAGGEVAEGFSSPLWLGVVTLVQALGGDPERASVAIGIVCVGVAALAVARAWRALVPGARWPAPALLVAASPALAWNGVAGLGTALLAATLAVGVARWAAAERKGGAGWGAGAWLAVSCLVRQEALLVALPFIAWRLVRGGPRAPAALPVLAVAAWSATRWAVFGRLVPTTYLVKALPLAEELRYGAAYLATATVQAGVGVLLVGALVAAWRRAGVVRLVAVGALAHAAYVVAVGGDWMPYARFFAPTWPLLALVTCAAARPWLASTGARAGALVAAALALQVGQLERAQVVGEHAFFEERWKRLGDHFRASVPADASIALSPIGAFGWRSRLRIVDLLGLTHGGLVDVPPDLARVSVKGHHRHDAEWALAQGFDYALLGNGVLQPDTGKLHVNPWEHDLVLHPEFAREYVQRRAPVPGAAPLEYFQRRDAPELPGAR